MNKRRRRIQKRRRIERREDIAAARRAHERVRAIVYLRRCVATATGTPHQKIAAVHAANDASLLAALAIVETFRRYDHEMVVDANDAKILPSFFVTTWRWLAARVAKAVESNGLHDWPFSP